VHRVDKASFIACLYFTTYGMQKRQNTFFSDILTSDLDDQLVILLIIYAAFFLANRWNLSSSK